MFNSYYILENDVGTVNTLQRVLEEFSEFTCMGNSDNYEDGMNSILKFTPDIIFINIDTVLKDYADIFSYCNEINDHIKNKPIYIALSKDETKAYKTIKNRFHDYVLKPGRELEIRKTIMQILKRKGSFLDDVLCLKSYKDFTLLDIDNILYLQADNNATDFILLGGHKISAFKTLKSFEAVLPENFLRIHHSYIVNKDHISRINFGRSKCYLNRGEITLPFSRSYKHNLASLEKLLSRSAITFN